LIFSSLFVSDFKFKYGLSSAAGTFKVYKGVWFSSVFDGCLKAINVFGKVKDYFIRGQAKFNKERRILLKWRLFSSIQIKATFVRRSLQNKTFSTSSLEKVSHKKMAISIRKMIPNKGTNTVRKERQLLMNNAAVDSSIKQFVFSKRLLQPCGLA